MCFVLNLHLVVSGQELGKKVVGMVISSDTRCFSFPNISSSPLYVCVNVKGVITGSGNLCRCKFCRNSALFLSESIFSPDSLLTLTEIFGKYVAPEGLPRYLLACRDKILLLLSWL